MKIKNILRGDTIVTLEITSSEVRDARDAASELAASCRLLLREAAEDKYFMALMRGERPHEGPQVEANAMACVERLVERAIRHWVNINQEVCK